VTTGSQPVRLGWFSTGRGDGSYGLLQAALAAIDSGRLNATLEFVFCNRERGQAPGSDRFMALVESRGVPLVCLSSKKFRAERDNKPWAQLREEYDRAAIDLLDSYPADISVNAGYMLIAPILCQAHRMINLHPALPDGPAGIWQNVTWDLIAQDAVETGAMVHSVTEEVDGGPVLSYCRFRIRGRDFDPLWADVAGHDIAELKMDPGDELPLFKAIRQAGVIRERPLLVATLCALADRRIDLDKTAGRPPLDLTVEVESVVTRSGS